MRCFDVSIDICFSYLSPQVSFETYDDKGLVGLIHNVYLGKIVLPSTQSWRDCRALCIPHHVAGCWSQYERVGNRPGRSGITLTKRLNVEM